jgi:hypothetical protein
MPCCCDQLLWQAETTHVQQHPPPTTPATPWPNATHCKLQPVHLAQSMQACTAPWPTPSHGSHVALRSHVATSDRHCSSPGECLHAVTVWTDSQLLTTTLSLRHTASQSGQLDTFQTPQAWHTPPVLPLADTNKHTHAPHDACAVPGSQSKSTF